MQISFTKHALQRIKARKISKDAVIDTIENPDSIKNDSYGNLVAQKIRDKYLLRVFYVIRGNTKIIISAYQTSKIEKYI